MKYGIALRTPADIELAEHVWREIQAKENKTIRLTVSC